MTKEELSFPLGLTSNADFCQQDPSVSYPIVLMQEPQSLSALCSSLRARGATPPDRKPPFLLGPRQAYPIGHHGKGSFLFYLALHIFYFSTGGKLKTLVATMALYKLPDTEAFNGNLPMSAPIAPTCQICMPRPMDKCLSDIGIPWNNSGLDNGQVQKAHFVQRTGIYHCLSYLCFHQ